MAASAPLRLLIDGGALVANWRWMAARSAPAACGAAVKADGYGLGAAEVVRRLRAAGCHDFFVATWAEAEVIAPHLDGADLSVLHGVGAEDLPTALATPAKPVLNTPEQARRWRAAGNGRPCDVMVDTGMNRLGLSAKEAASGLLDGLAVETLMSHLARADEDHALNARQAAALREVGARVGAQRLSLANSAGVLLGPDYRFDLTRPGLALYGGFPRPEAAGSVRQVVRPQARVLQRRRLPAGEGIGYNHLHVAAEDREVAILNIGYADGYLRGFTNRGAALAGERRCPVLGRVSMDLTAVDVTGAEVGEGDWLPIDFDLPRAAKQSGLSQYELLTGLGARYTRVWR